MKDGVMLTENEFWEKLAKPVLMPEDKNISRKRELLKSSFNIDLLKMFTEIHNWKKAGT
jgi:hypothetical protein